MRASRLIVASFLIPVASFLSYTLAVWWNGGNARIDTFGSILGVLLIVGAVFGVSRVADDEKWTERAGTSLALASSYFALTWVAYGDPALSNDDAPHLIWFGLCVAAFAPAVVIIPASKWAWAEYRERIAPPEQPVH
jgi:hypothetical protein